MKIIDLTHELNNEVESYPGDSEISIERSKTFDKDGYTLTEVTTNMHIGTHVEVPLHLSNKNEEISQYHLEKFIGSAKIIDERDNKSGTIDWKKSYQDIIVQGDIVIICTGHEQQYGHKDYFSKYPVLSDEFIEMLCKIKIKLLVLDTPSPDYYPYDAHKRLFNSDIAIVENANNTIELLNYKEISFFGVPLKITAEASLIRAFAIIY